MDIATLQDRLTPIFPGLIGVRLTTVQVARFVPLVGQVASAAIGYGAIRFLGQQHIQDCVRVVRQAGLALPPPTD
jgi:hypothetical protein